MSGFDFGSLMPEVAKMLLGAPNPHHSKGNDHRYGTNGSLSIDLEKNTAFDHENDEGGGVLWLVAKLTGCGDDGAVDWLKSNGFDIPDMRVAAAGSNQNAGPGRKEIVAAYDYADIDGNLVFQVVRMQYRMPDGSWRLNRHGKIDKTFAQRRRFEEEKDVWINGLLDGEYMRKGPGQNWTRYDSKTFDKWGMKERREFDGIEQLPLYRWPEVAEAIAMGQAIYLVEGEKKADALWKAGIAATCNAGGAKKWTPYHAELLRGAHIIQIPDNDDAGRMHMQIVGSRMKDIAASVMMLDIRTFWPEVPEKGDIWDWVQAGGDASDLFDLVDKHARPWTKEPPKSRFGAVTWDRLDEAGQEHEYLIEDILTRHEVAVIYGESGSGKSFEAIDMAMAVDRGVPFNGKEVRKGGVIYQAGEGGIGVKLRLRAYRQTYMEPGERVDFVLLPSRVDLFAKPGEQDVETSRGTDALIAEIKAWAETFTVPLELVVIDTLATATPGANENASTDMSVVLTNLERIRDECRCTVLMVHHKPRNGNNPRGHSSLFANVDNAIELEITQRLDVAYRADGTQLVRQIHRATIQKNKDGERGHGWDFILKQVVLGTRPNGKPLTSVVCAPPGGQGPEVTDDKRLSDQQAIAMQALINALERHGEATPDMLKLPKSIKTVVRMGHWRLEYAALSMMDDEDPKKKQERIKKALQRAGERFFGAKWIGRAEPYVWLTGRPVPGFKRDSDMDFNQLSRPQEPVSEGLAEVLTDGEIQF
ncbi:MAG: hypothetical protein E5X35_07520 [Mesorhizobium sp.]|uniref:AAA family ATPase n=1 Tax=Mesorhizobium sp. TaxID=1871066 RepID=UPI001209A7CA|nr:AAA family ATPase [Mesorhizobium sp.]TIR34553.1 MAG: hypothetical protein E5X35_07520 [Mesorhizobium sp.]